MKRKTSFLLLASLTLSAMVFGCVTTGSQPMYYWENYSDSLYQTKKHPTPETLAEHQSVLEKIIETSKENNCRIPPGVCAELGYIYAMRNDNKKAIELFTQEKQIYPEATLFMDRLIQRSERRPESEKATEATSQPVVDKSREAAVEKVGMEEKAK
ncbi:MAG: DUF4810 domain-containing protein [Desulfatitalea sp.]|nr:DUF4810 domain-containing protein [Desulfatitalea sp.]MBI5895732.1 DUF4810 domain-containing protein [Desulfobacterales bacterium]